MPVPSSALRQARLKPISQAAHRNVESSDILILSLSLGKCWEMVFFMYLLCTESELANMTGSSNCHLCINGTQVVRVLALYSTVRLARQMLVFWAVPGKVGVLYMWPSFFPP